VRQLAQQPEGETQDPVVPGQPLLVTMGDPVGIGPECVVRAHARGALGSAVVIGDPLVMQRAARACGLEVPVAQIWRLGDAASASPHTLAVLRPESLGTGLSELPWGRVSPQAGAAAACCITTAVELLSQGDGAALVTAPIHKAAFAAAGIGYPGHTEMLQALCSRPGQPPPAVRMMLANEELRVVLVTIHQSLRSAIEAITFDAVLQTLRIAHAAAQRWGQPAARIAVAGLNPHAGEDGLFGDEELRFIGPAVAAARSEGIDARGPFAPDTVFMRARNTVDHPGEFDLVVAMTHDHGLIPVKYLGVEQGVNVTLGLPLIRTSPDHGTAFDIAGRGLADSRSLEAAARWARHARLSRE
jgi:4-hydroxythreonine-4-phosphate dehydrogenase